MYSASMAMCSSLIHRYVMHLFQDGHTVSVHAVMNTLQVFKDLY